MRIWNLGQNDPLSLTLAADARLGPTNYGDDQIWELQIGGSDPPAVMLYTTFGLRARSLRIFPRFSDGDQSIVDPDNFNQPATIFEFFSKLLKIAIFTLPEYRRRNRLLGSPLQHYFKPYPDQK